MSFVQEHLSQPLARQVFFTSFFFAQGNAYLHKLLFEAIVARRPTWRLSREIENDLLQQVSSSTRRLIAKGGHKFLGDNRSIEEEVLRMLKAFQEALTRGNDFTDELKKELACRVILQDFRFLHLQIRVRKPSGGQTCSPHCDRWISHFCYYILLQQRTGIAVFDEIFLALSRHCQKDDPIYLQIANRVWDELKMVVHLYNEHHPEMGVTLEPPFAYVENYFEGKGDGLGETS